MMTLTSKWRILSSGVALVLIVSPGQRCGGQEVPRNIPGPGKARPRDSDRSIARLLQELRGRTASEPWRVARAQAQAGDAAAARATLVQALQVARDSRSLLAIAEVQGEMGDRDAALKTLLTARRPDLAEPEAGWEPAKTLSDIAALQRQLNDRVASRETFDQALRFARMLAPDQTRFAIEQIVNARADSGDLLGALDDVAKLDDLGLRFDVLAQLDVENDSVDPVALGRVLQMLDTDKVPPSTYQGVDVRKERVNGKKIEVLLRMALIHAAANEQAGTKQQLQRARRIADALQEEATRYSYLGRIAQVLVKTGAGDQARRIADGIGDTMWNRKLGLLTDIANAHAEMGDRVGSLKAWDDALAAAKTGSEKLGVLLAIAEAQLKGGNRAAWSATLDRALIAARSIKGEDQDAYPFDPVGSAVAPVAKARAEGKDISGAIRLANTIENKQIQGDALATIASLQAESGDIAGALATARSIRPPDRSAPFVSHKLDKSSALLGIIAAQARARDVTGALATTDLLTSRDERYIALLVIAEGLGPRRERERRVKVRRAP